MSKRNLGLPKAYWEIEVRDKNGKLLEHKRIKSHSWLRAFIGWLKMCATVGGATFGATITDITGTARTVPYSGTAYVSAFAMGYNGGAGVETIGILVGSGDTPNSINTYALASKIAHGTGSGQLVHGATTVEDVTNPSGNDLQFRVTRTFTNNSGASVTTKEIGIYGAVADSGNTTRYFCIVRDVLPSPSSIPDGATMTVRYIIKITVS
jgi:hypothetical protein